MPNSALSSVPEVAGVDKEPRISRWTPSSASSSQCSSSQVKIIDIQKTKYHEDDDKQHWGANRNNPATAVPQQVNPDSAHTSASRWPLGSTGRGTNQKQQSGDTLSSFESDYDLLVYLGETETEDIVDTERSADYQDQTWRQSICGGASLAPTIDESLSELLGSFSPCQPQDFDLLGGSPLVPKQLGHLTGVSTYARLSFEPEDEIPRNNAHSSESTPTIDQHSSLQVKQIDQYLLSSPSPLPTLDHARPAQRDSIGDRLESLFDWKLPQGRPLREPTLMPSDRSTGHKVENVTMVAPGDASELDRLLAEMNRSLDLDALARYDPFRGQAYESAQSKQNQTSIPNPEFRPGSLSPIETTHMKPPKRPSPPAKTNAESILDEYEGASKMLEQMISEQLEESNSFKPTTLDTESRDKQPLSSQMPSKKVNRDNKSFTNESHLEQKHEEHSETRKMSTCSSSVASVVPVAGRSISSELIKPARSSPLDQTTRSVKTPTQSSIGSWRLQKTLKDSQTSLDRQATKTSPSPELTEGLAPSSELASQMSSDTYSHQDPPPPPERDYDQPVEIRQHMILEHPSRQPMSGIDRMKQRTLYSMRSMRSKITGFVSSHENKRATSPKSVQGSLTLPDAKQLNPDRLGRPKTRVPQNEPSQSQSFGQQIRERLSRSKNRLSRFLRPETKRAQSNPNTRWMTPTEIDDRKLVEPGDIARNCEPLVCDQASTQKRSKSSSDSSLSGLDTSRSECRPKVRGRTRTTQRSSSLLSIKRLSSMKQNSQDKDEDLDTMKVSTLQGLPTSAKRVSRRKLRSRKAVKSNLQNAPETTSCVGPPVSTTNEYFGVIAPARADSPEEVGCVEEPVETLTPPRCKLNRKAPRSQSMRNVSRPNQPKSTIDAVGVSEAKRTVSFSNLSRRTHLPVTTNSFRPVSACGQLNTSQTDKSQDSRMSFVGPVNSSYQEQSHQLTLDLIPTIVEPDLLPKRPPRRNRSKSCGVRPDEETNVIVVQAETPGSTMDRRQNVRVTSSAGRKLVSLAQQLTHSAADFFDARRSRRVKREIRPNPQPVPGEWRPVIDTRTRERPLVDSHTGKATTFNKLEAEKDDRTGLTRPRQRSLDTDSTWESSVEENDNEERVRSGSDLACLSNDSSSALINRNALDSDDMHSNPTSCIQATTDTVFVINNRLGQIRNDESNNNETYDVCPTDSANLSELELEENRKNLGNKLENSQATNKIENISKTPFKFNADLPPPSQLLTEARSDNSEPDGSSLTRETNILESDGKKSADSEPNNDMAPNPRGLEIDNNKIKLDDVVESNRLSMYDNVSGRESLPLRPCPTEKPVHLLDNISEAVSKESPRPERRLIAQTSITRDPNDNLMVTQLASLRSSFSIANENDNSDTDSSFAAVLDSRQRFKSRLMGGNAQVVLNKPRPSEGSLVKRLARNYEQQVIQEPTRGPRASAAPRKLSLISTETLASFEEELKSESTWYDAKSINENLDEAEVSEFLRRFDCERARQQSDSGHAQASEPGTGSVSTGLEPFVTVAESTLELEEDDELSRRDGDDDDTLNDQTQLDEECEDEGARSELDVPSELGGESGGSSGSGEMGVKQGKDRGSFSVIKIETAADSCEQQQEPIGETRERAVEERADSRVERVSGGVVVVADVENRAFATTKNHSEQILHNSTNHLDLPKPDKPQPPPPVTINAGQLIDDKFKNSLNHIIARRASNAQLPTIETLAMSEPKDTANGMRNNEPKGLSRFYRAFMRQGRRRHKKELKDEEAKSKSCIIDDYIHSSSSSSSCSTSSDEEEDEQSCQKPEIRCQLFKELEKILANQVSDQRARMLTRANGIDKDVDQDEPEDESTRVSRSSSSVSSESFPEMKQRRNLQKLYCIVNEIYSSEAKFVDTLRLLNEDFPRHMLQSTNKTGLQVPTECLSSMMKHLPQLQALNENLLEELKLARDKWPLTQKIAHVLVKIGPFLKHYSIYIRDFESIQQQLAESAKKYPHFAEGIKQFEASDRCQKLTIQHHLLKPIQRIPQYRLLLQQYLHHLKPDDNDYEDTVNALEVVSRVAEHANQSMSEGVNMTKLLALQAKIVGKQRDIIQPGRSFVKEGELMKVCRKQIQPRWFILLSDALLYLTQIQASDMLILNYELSLDDCIVSTPTELKQTNLIGRQFDTEFSVSTRTRSFSLIAKSGQDRDQWVQVMRRTIDEHMARRRSFTVRQADAIEPPPQAETQELGVIPTEPELLGQKAPIWTPDSRVSMCQLCTSSFSALFRRHHCRACGRVVCSACSSNKAPLVYLKCRSARVCDQCFQQLKSSIHLYLSPASSSSTASAADEQEIRQLDERFRTLLRSQFVRHTGLRGLRLSRNSSGASAHSVDTAGDKRSAAKSEESIISGYLHRRDPRKPRWKRQWFEIKHKVLYAYRAIDDIAFVNSFPLLGCTIDQPEEPVDGLDPGSLLRLSYISDQHIRSAKANECGSCDSTKGKISSSPSGKSEQQDLIAYLFKAESSGAAERWLEALRQSTKLDQEES